jgi:GntR family transcriptional regulator / MocR family aminotransferase
VAGMYATVPTTPGRARRVQAAAREAGFEVPMLRDYCRTARLSGVIIGFGGCTDDELDRALAAVVRGLG